MNKAVKVYDISFYQDIPTTPQRVDFAKMKASGGQGVIIRVGQRNYIDRDFHYNWSAAKGILPRGAYWFYDSREKPLVQAALFANALIQDGLPEMEVWCDYEETYGGSYPGWRNFAVFVAEVERLLPSCRVGIYTGYYYWQDHRPNVVFQSASFYWFAKYPLWLAWYTLVDANVKIPAPWKTALYWQATDTADGLAAGAESKEIDLSYFQGTEADFAARYKLAIVPVPDPDPVHVPVVTLISVTPKPLVETTVIVQVDGDPFSLKFDPAPVVVPPVVPPAPAPAFPHMYSILDDVAAGYGEGKVRPYLRDGLPCTVPLQGGSANLKVPDRWVEYLRTIMTNQVVDNYLFRVASGWQNGDEFGVVRCLTFGGNVVNVLSIEGTHAYVETVSINAVPPDFPIQPAVDRPHKFIHRFSTQFAPPNNNPNNLDMTTNGRNPFIILFAKPGERLWIDIRNLERLP